MCSGPRKPTPTSSPAAAEALLDLAAADDLPAFTAALAAGADASAFASWYSRRLDGAMAAVDRTPVMVAALYGSTRVLAYVLALVPSEATRVSPSDGATPLHLAAAGGAASSPETVRIILSAATDAAELVDSFSRRPGDVVSRAVAPGVEKELRMLLNSPSSSSSPESSPKKQEKKEYPPDLTLPDIKTGIFSTDEFRMYTFKVKPCSRAYSHDWTECPFVHPGENARRRDPRKYLYSCVPCPEFRKGGACRKGDGCEYAHGVFESWLHPAQYRTRLCKDEVGCKRRICFFAHKQDELRAVNPAAASVALSSPVDPAAAAMLLLPQSSSPRSPASWLSGSTRFNELDLLALEQYQQKLFDKVSNAASPRANWGSPVAAAAAARSPSPPDFGDLLGSVDPAMLSHLQALSLKQTEAQLAGTQLLSRFDSVGLPPSSPLTGGGDRSMAKAIMNSRAAAFAKRSQSFIDRSSPTARSSVRSLMTPNSNAPSMLSDWGSPDGKLDWGIQNDELHKLRKSASFGIRTSPTVQPAAATNGGFISGGVEEPDLSWVNSLVKDGQAHAHGHDNGGEPFPLWAEPEQMVA